MNIKRHKFEITGIAPLLQNNPANLNTKAKMGVGGTYIAEEMAKHVRYSNKNGQAFIPSVSFRKAILSAAGGKKFKKRTARAVIASSVFNATEETVILRPKSKQPYKSDEYQIDARPVVRNKARVMAWRPRWEEWSAVLELDIDEDLIDPALVLENLSEGGLIAGVGDFRPEKMGPFGRFTAKAI